MPEKRTGLGSRIEVVALALVVALGVATAIAVPFVHLPASSTHAASEQHHTPKPAAMGSYPAKKFAAAAAALPKGLSTAVIRDLHETAAQYLADAAAGEQAVKVIADIKASGTRVLGSKMSGTELTVYVASKSDTAAVEAAGATAVVGAPKVPDFSHNNYQKVDSSNIYGGEGYFFYSQAGQNSGSGAGDLCSIGFNGYAQSDGAPQFVTAGHCQTVIPSGNSVFLRVQSNSGVNLTGALTVGAALGTAVAGEGSYGGNNDYGIVSAGDAGVITNNSVATWGGNDGTSPSNAAPLSSTPLAITGETAAIVGDQLCKSGSTSGWTCGVIQAVDQQISVSGQPVNTIVSTTCLLPGDSGGGAVMGTDAVGIDSGSNFPTSSNSGGTNGYPCGNTDSAYTSVFFPMVSADAGAHSVQSQLGSNWQLGVSVPNTITLTPPAATLYQDASFAGTISGPLSGTSTALLYVDGSTVPFAHANASSGSWTIPLAGMSVGTHTYSLAAGSGWSPGTAVTGSITMSATPAGRQAILNLYNSLGGASGSLGAITTATQAVGAGFREDFTNGSIFWSAATGAIVVSGGELTAYTSNGGPTGTLGWPTSSIISEPSVNGGGSGQVFQGGSIYVSPAGGFAVMGAIRSAFWAAGGEAGSLAWPTGAQTSVAGGLSQSFTGGTIFWSAATGAFVSSGAELSAYTTAGGPAGSLGWPTSGVINEPTVHGGGSGQVFQGGSIYASSAGGFPVIGAIRTFYWSQGGEGGVLGWPTAAQTTVSGGLSQTFQGGTIVWSSTAGAHIALTAPFEAAYDAAGGAAVLGNATSGVISEPSVNGGGSGQVFQGGSIYVSPAGGFAVMGAIRSAFWAAGGEAGSLAWPTGAQTSVAGGLSQSFTGGTIFWSAATGAFVSSGAELSAYTTAGGPAGSLGWPTSGVINEPTVHGGGSGQVFQGGSIYASSAGGFPVIGAIRTFYWSQGGEGGVLGWPTAAQTTVSGGLSQTFQGGTIVWSSTAGAHIALTAPFEAAYDAAGGAAVLGNATSGVISEPSVNGGGSGQVFQGGSIYVSPAGGFAVMGAIRSAFWAAGGEAGSLAWPTGAQTSVAGGLSQSFTGGTIFWSAATGAFVSSGAELSAYTTAGGPAGSLGWPTSGVINEPTVHGGGSGQVFQGGSIYASSAGGFPVIGAIRSAFWAAGGEAGSLAWPTGAQTSVAGGLSQSFTGGTIFWSAATGANAVSGPELSAYNTAGGPAGILEWPTSALISEPSVHGGGSGQVFQGGSIYASTAGAFPVTGAVRTFYWSEGGESGILAWPTGTQTPVSGGVTQAFQGGTITTVGGTPHLQ